MKLFDEGIKITKEDILEFEEKLNTKFPETYVDFLLESNGESSYDDIIKVNYIMKSEGLVPEECLVFADDSAGNPICMKTGGENQESIFFCDHELENTNDGYLLMSKVADSFDEFIETLYIIE